MSLASLIVAMYQHPEVRKRLGSDPQEVFKEYQLSEEDVNVLRSHDMLLIADRAAEDIRGMLIALARPETLSIYVWSPQPPNVKKITPSKAASGVTTAVMVDGANFGPGAQLIFRQVHTSIEIAATDEQVASNGRSLTANIQITVQQKTVYDVIVRNTDGSQGVLSAAFTVA